MKKFLISLMSALMFVGITYGASTVESYSTVKLVEEINEALANPEVDSITCLGDLGITASNLTVKLRAAASTDLGRFAVRSLETVANRSDSDYVEWALLEAYDSATNWQTFAWLKVISSDITTADEDCTIQLWYDIAGTPTLGAVWDSGGLTIKALKVEGAATFQGAATISGKTTCNGELEVNGSDVDINMTLTNNIVRIDQTNAAGNAAMPLIAVADARTGVTADTADEATLVITAAGAYGLSVADGIVNIEGEIDSTGDITIDPDGDDVIIDGTVDATAYKADAGSGIDAESTGALDIGNTTATSIDFGNTNVTAHTFVANGTGDAKVVLPLLSIGDGEINDVSAAKLAAASVATAIDINAATNFNMANLAAGTTAAAFDGSAVTALDAANISAGTVMPAVDGGAITGLNVYGSPGIEVTAITAASLFSTNTITLKDVDGNTMTGYAVVHVWQGAAASAMTFPDSVAAVTVAANEDYWRVVTNVGTMKWVIEEASITTNTAYVSVGPNVASTNITLLP